jgi:hypothetical protein
MFTRRRVIGAGAAGLAMLACGCATSASTPRGTALASDIRLLRRAYETLHPGLYRYNTKPEMDALFERLESDWAKGPALPEAYLSLSGLLAKVRCGHSYANFYNQSDAVTEALFAGAGKLPFLFIWLDGRMVVTNPQGTDGLARGDAIEQINGQRSEDILKALLPYARADGNNRAKRVSLMSVSGLDMFETFDVFHGLAFGRAPLFRLNVLGADGNRREIEAASITLSDRQARMTPEQEGGAAFTRRFEANGACVLRMPGWALYDSDWDWKGFIDDTVREIADRKAPALIVDLRGNEGGLDCGDEILARLISVDLPRTAYERRVRYQKTPADLDPYLDTWDNSFRDYSADTEPHGDGFYRLIERDGASRAPITPKGPRYGGKLIVLTDASNSSATFQFANLVKANGLGTLIGETTGGSQRGINGGAFFFLRLPESGLEVDLPLIGTFPLTPKPDAGIEPDIFAAPTQASLAAGSDPVLEAALALV